MGEDDDFGGSERERERDCLVGLYLPGRGSGRRQEYYYYYLRGEFLGHFGEAVALVDDGHRDVAGALRVESHGECQL